MKNFLAFLLVVSAAISIGIALWVLELLLCIVLASWLIVGGIADDLKLLWAKAAGPFSGRVAHPRG